MMNVKNKIISFIMSFVIIFGTVSSSFADDKKSLNYNIKPLVFDGGIISAPMLGVVTTLAVGSGLIINNSEDIINLGNNFYNYYKDNMEQIESVFNACVSIGVDKVVTVGSDFLEYVKEFLDFTFNSKEVSPAGYYQGIPIFTNTINAKCYNPLNFTLKTDGTKFVYGDFEFYNKVYTWGYHNGESILLRAESRQTDFSLCLVQNGSRYIFHNVSKDFDVLSYLNACIYFDIVGDFTLDKKGDYSWDNVSDKLNDDDSVGVYVPGNLDSFVGNPSLDVFNNPSYDLPNDGLVVVPGVDSPSISVDSNVSIPGVNSPGVDSPSIPNDSIWSTIKDFVISLVVPSDTFWTDTFNGFRDNFSKNFPMLDMSKFDSLAVGGKPFPNLYAYGSKIVDGDVINSIVDWLRPIIAGFIMICLMFFNYRKIYKLIRNTEPFGGIAQGSSDFRTGMSAPPINNGLDPNPMGNLRDTLFDMRNEILRRENSK